MSAISLLVGLLLGIVIGAAIGYLYARGARWPRPAGPPRRARAAEQRAALIDGQLAERFAALSAQALDASTARFLEVAEGRLHAANATAAGELETRRAAVEHLVTPLKETLARVEASSCGSPTRPGCARTPRSPSRSPARGRPPSSCGPRPRRWSPRCDGRRPGAAGASCSCAGWSSWPG